VLNSLSIKEVEVPVHPNTPEITRKCYLGKVEPALNLSKLLEEGQQFGTAEVPSIPDLSGRA